MLSRKKTGINLTLFVARPSVHVGHLTSLRQFVDVSDSICNAKVQLLIYSSTI